MPQPLEPAGFGGVAVRPPKTAAQRTTLQQPSVVAEMAIEPAAAQCPHAVTDVVAHAVRGIEEGIAPIREEQCRQSVRLVVIDECERNIRTKAVVAQELRRSKDRTGIQRPTQLAVHHQIAERSIGAQGAPHRIDRLLVRGKAKIARWKERARRCQHVDVAARPAGNAQHLVDRRPRDTLPRALDARQALLLDRRDEPVIVERRRGAVVTARVNCQNTHEAEVCGGPSWDTSRLHSGIRSSRQPLAKAGKGRSCVRAQGRWGGIARRIRARLVLGKALGRSIDAFARCSFGPMRDADEAGGTCASHCKFA